MSRQCWATSTSVSRLMGSHNLMAAFVRANDILRLPFLLRRTGMPAASKFIRKITRKNKDLATTQPVKAFRRRFPRSLPGCVHSSPQKLKAVSGARG
jgi:hypothetical protein